MVSVTIPVEMARSRDAIIIPLPEGVRSELTDKDAAITVSLVSGGNLPTWCKYDASSKTFVLQNIAVDQLPMSVLVSSGGKNWHVEVKASSANY
jgi:chitinase